MRSRVRVPGTFALVLMIEVLLGAGVVALAVRADDGSASAANLLARARAFVGREQTVRYDGRTSAAQLDTLFGAPARLEGVAAMPDRFRVVQASGGDRVEVMGVGDDRYVRPADPEEREGDDRWFKLPEPAKPGDAGPPEGLGGPFSLPPELRALAAVAGHAVFMSPTGLPEALAAAEAPVLRDRGRGRAELRARVVPARLFGSQVAEVDEARIELTVADDGRVDHVRLFVRSEELGVDVSVSYDLEGWGSGEVAIEPPADDEVVEEGDAVVDPDALAAFDDVPLLMPKGVPDGWSVELATVLDADETVEGCPQAMLVFADPEAPDEGYLEVYQFPVGCSLGPSGEDPARFEAGGRRGWVEDDGDFRFGELYVDGAVFQFSSTLSVEDLQVLFAELVPLDLANPPAGIPGIGGTTETF